jgi:hypothetical protein
MLQDGPDADVGRCSLWVPNIEQTYNQVSITGAVHFVCDVDGAAPAMGDSNLAFFLRLEVPDGVVVFWVLQQLLGCHGGHDGKVLLQGPWTVAAAWSDALVSLLNYATTPLSRQMESRLCASE